MFRQRQVHTVVVVGFLYQMGKGGEVRGDVGNVDYPHVRYWGLEQLVPVYGTMILSILYYRVGGVMVSTGG